MKGFHIAVMSVKSVFKRSVWKTKGIKLTDPDTNEKYIKDV